MAWLVITGQQALVTHQTIPALLYYANFVRAGGGWLNELNHTWTLAIEEQFYLLWPALMLLVGGRLRWIALVAALGAVAAALVRLVAWTGPASIPFVYFSTFARADGILLGCLLAIVWRRLPPLRHASSIGLIGVGLVILASVPRDQTWTYVWAPVAAELGAVAMIVWAMDRPSFLGWRPLTVTGRLSYSLYLWSPPLMLWVLPRLHLGGVVLGFGLSFAAASASYLLVERPFLGLKARWTAGRERATPLLDPSQ